MQDSPNTAFGGEGDFMIDWARVNELRDEIGAESFDEVAVMFLDEADEAIARLDLSKGAKSLESDLHFLKGSALNLGFQLLADLCQTGERTAASGSVEVDLEAVIETYHASKKAFDAGRVQLSAEWAQSA